VYTIKTLNGVNSAVIKSSIYAKRYIGQLSPTERYEGAGYVVNVFQTGDSYFGSFKDGLLHGSGTYTFKNGDSYIGDFNENYFEGIGTFDQPSIGQSYTGDWSRDKKNGEGSWFN